MKASSLTRVGVSLLKQQQPFMIWGAPGGGKSSVVKGMVPAFTGKPAVHYTGKKNDKGNFIDLRLPLLDSVDLRGIPTNVDGKTVWLTPSMLPRDGSGIIFLDELVQAMPIVMSAASSLILDRRIGEYELPPGWSVCAAGNRDSDRAATNKMPSHIANRFTHLEFTTDAEDWMQIAVDNDFNELVIHFIGFRPALLHVFDPKQRSFPSPRSWEFVSKIIGADDMDDDLFEVITGTVGEAAATEFMAFCRVFRELPDYDSILANPATTQIPANAAARYATAAMLGMRAKQADMKKLMQYIERMPKEFQILVTQDMVKKNKKLAETQAYILWSAHNKDLLLNATAR